MTSDEIKERLAGLEAKRNVIKEQANQQIAYVIGQIELLEEMLEPDPEDQT